MDFNVNLGGVISLVIVILTLILGRYVFPVKVYKKQLIDRVKFEKEFEIYKELWGKLFVLQNLVKRYLLTPRTDPSDRKKAWDILVSLKHQHDKVQSITDRNKPFYDPEVYKNARKVLMTSLERQSPLARYVFRRHRGETPSYEEISEDDFKSIDNEYEKIDDIIDEVEKAIRKKIGFPNKSK